MNLIVRVLFLSCLIILQSCGGHFHLSAKGCDHTTQWIIDAPPEWGDQGLKPKEKINYDFEMKRTVFTGSKLSDRLDKFVINDLLKEKELVCRDLESLTVISKATFWDNVFGLIPFISQKTLIIKGIKKTQPETEADDKKKESDKGEEKDAEEQDEEEQDEEEQDEDSESEVSKEDNKDSSENDEFEQQLKELEDRPEGTEEEVKKDEKKKQKSEDESEEDSEEDEESDEDDDSVKESEVDMQSPDEEDSSDEIEEGNIELDSFED